MRDANTNQPKLVKQVMVSSTFKDLGEHRQILIQYIKGNGFSDNVMENDAAKPVWDVIDSSLDMVRDSHAYIAVISMKYGQVPEDKERNPDNLSITELEFREAVKQGRPILLFIMSEEHPVKGKDVEKDTVKMVKLEAFRQHAKKNGPDTTVHRVYSEFKSIVDFAIKAGIAISKLRSFLEKGKDNTVQSYLPTSTTEKIIPQSRALYIKTVYASSHDFVGRREQLETITEWANPADTHNMLFFEAMGGNGKSMLTWEWVKNHAPNIRTDWAGIFWYSFYEKGATMADYCRHALAYISGQPIKELVKKKTPELFEALYQYLIKDPWLLVLDGLERVLMEYNTVFASQNEDEEPELQQGEEHRDPCSVVDPADNDVLRKLAAARPSKILVSSRLFPTVLLNPSHQPLPGIKRIPLGGLKPADALEMFSACGVSGDAAAIQNYLITNCDCHPLVIGALAGIINNYLPDPGNFDSWEKDPAWGGAFNWAQLVLKQRQSHILQQALDNLLPKSRQLLDTLSLLAWGIDYNTLKAFNPHLPPQPEEVEEPNDSEIFSLENILDADKQRDRKESYYAARQKYLDYKEKYSIWLKLQNDIYYLEKLTRTVMDLKNRGLLQYDEFSRHYDLHPVVRTLALNALQETDKESLGMEVINYFNKQPHKDYDEVKELGEIENMIQTMRTYLHLRRFDEAYNIYQDLEVTILFNLEEYEIIQALLRPFFHKEFGVPKSIIKDDYSGVLNSLGISFSRKGDHQNATNFFKSSLLIYLKRASANIPVILRNLSVEFEESNSLYESEQLILKSLQLAKIENSREDIFVSNLLLFIKLGIRGDFEEADNIWRKIEAMGRDWNKAVYRQGDAEFSYVQYLFRQKKLKLGLIEKAIEICNRYNNRVNLRGTYGFKGYWLLEQENFAVAIEPLQIAIQMARRVKVEDVRSETLLAIAQLQAGQLENPEATAEKLSFVKYPDYLNLAELWRLLNNTEKAKEFALQAYKWAWADGEPYVHRFELNKAIVLLEKLNTPIPELSTFDASRYVKEDWEIQLDEYIEKHQQEAEAKKAKKDNN